ncbi:hypothetical protein UB35_19955 [Photobacterium angustum]|nr:hypothetical protein UB35_19955 [Photobacterium angustum]PSV61687.1 hypothetical protein CTM95_20510 [Photobacterium angustum]
MLTDSERFGAPIRVTSTSPKPEQYGHDYGYVRVYRGRVKIAEVATKRSRPLKILRSRPNGPTAKKLLAQCLAAGCSEGEIDYIMQTDRYKAYLAKEEERDKQIAEELGL